MSTNLYLWVLAWPHNEDQSIVISKETVAVQTLNTIY
jgi:hypothetical protein